MFDWLNEKSRLFLERGYLKEWVSPEERIREIADTFAEYSWDKKLWDKFYEYMGKGYYSLSSPVWSNYWLERGLPISCFGSYIWDSMESILNTQAEVGMMSKYGWGTSWYFWDIRARWADIKDNGKSSGAVHFMQLFETLTDVVSQGSMRRWAFSPYLPVDHWDIMEFLDIWTEWNPIQKCTTGVCIPEGWMDSMIEGDSEKRKVWAKVLQRRKEMWYPYIFFSDNANKDSQEKIHCSNLCSEIMLPSKWDESFVCCLSSMNVVKFDEWKSNDAVQVMTKFLDTVIEEFIQKTEWKKFMERARKFAIEKRAIGVWVLWYHSYLQSKNIPFESKEARGINEEVFRNIALKTILSSNGNNSHLQAVAPTTSSAFILGQVSQSIEPWFSNYFVKDLAKDKVTVKNKYLEKVLEEKGKNTEEVWDSIRDNDGSVQHLDILSENEKNVFKTYSEIDPYEVIDQAATRQQFIDQGQSLNLMINPSTPTKDINALYIDAWKQWIKSLYYQHSINAAQELSRFKCSGCES